MPISNLKSQNQHTGTILALNSSISNVSFPDFDNDISDWEWLQWCLSFNDSLAEYRTRVRLWKSTVRLYFFGKNGEINWGHSCFDEIKHDNVDISNNDELATISPRDKPWDKHRTSAEEVEELYLNSDFSHYSKRMSECSQILSFGLVPVDNEIRIKLRSTRSCHVRHCPVCLWRKSLMWKSKAHKLLPEIVKDYPKYRWLFLTLTITIMPIEELKSSLQLMKTGFERLSKVKAFPAEGWIKSLEVTRCRHETAHPHYHCLLMVKPSYFNGDNYITQEKWVAMWKKAMRLDYDPQVDIRAISKFDDPVEIIPELLKYVTKPVNLTASKEWLIEYTNQMQNVRSVSTGGILKKYLKELEKEPEDLIGKDEESNEIKDDETRLNFSWRTEDKKYKLVK